MVALITQQKKEKRLNPSISIGKLAEYMTASPIRRRQIIASMKADKDFIKVRYSKVRNIIQTFFESQYDNSILSKAVAEIEKGKPITEWDRNDNENSILALDAMKSTLLPDLSEYSFIADQGIKTIRLAGVEIFIRPELYIQHNHTAKVGAIKIHIAKTHDNRLKEENRKYAATLLKIAFMEHGVNESDIDVNACISYDVFLKEYSCANESFKQRVRSIEASCEEIALRWKKI